MKPNGTSEDYPKRIKFDGRIWKVVDVRQRGTGKEWFWLSLEDDRMRQIRLSARADYDILE